MAGSCGRPVLRGFFEELPYYFHNDCINAHSYQWYVSSPFSASSSPFVISCLSDNSHPNRCEVISQCGFDLYFLIISDVDHLFIYLLAIYMPSLEKNLYLVPLPIFN